MSQSTVRSLAGLATVVVLVAIVVFATAMFRGDFVRAVPVTVISERAGLVMNPDAKVKLHGALVGKVDSIEALPNGQAAVHLSMDPSYLSLIPANTLVNIVSTTVFGSKYVQLVAPPDPSTQSLQAGAVLTADHVTVEFNTIFEKLVTVLSTVEPAKLNATLGALSSAFSGRGATFGQSLVDLDALLARLDPSLEDLSRDIAAVPPVVNAYADGAPDLLKTADAAARISTTVVEKASDLDAVLLSAIGLAETGNDVLSTNRPALTDVLHLLVPTTDLTNQYHEALTCGLGGLAPFATAPPSPMPGAVVSTSLVLGRERYRYPANLPKVAATGGPFCNGLPEIPFEYRPPYPVTDTGANQAQYGNQGILLNSEALKQALFGPLDGPPRNTAQIGQPG